MKYNRKTSLLCVAVLACTAFAVGCQKQPSEKVPEVVEKPPVVSEPVEQVQETEPVISPEEGQLQLLWENRSLWEREEEYAERLVAVTDLDHNGRLELVTSICEGSGLYTYTDIYEVDEAFAGLVACESDWGEGESQPDLGVAEWTTYYDASMDTYHYVLEDTIRNGVAESYENLCDYSLKDGKISQKVIAYVHHVMDMETGEVTSTYANAEEEAITEEAYNSVIETVFEGMEKKQTHVEWVTEPNEEALRSSYQQFGG